MKPAVFLPAAETEFAEAASFYEAQTSGLGDEFISEVERAVNELARHPELGTPYFNNTRRVLVRRFPFSIVYRDRADQTLIVAVAHQSQRPGYWRNRE